MQSHARVVVVGGGCVGVNIAHELARRGWTDVALLERTELTAGSTWHAAGLIPIYSFSYNFGRLIAKTIEIYEALEAETGQAVGWHKCGQLRVANTPARMDEYLNYASIAETQGVRAEICSAERVRELWPLFDGHKNILGGVFNPDDGHIAPADVTQAAAAGARSKGVKIYRDTEVTSFKQTASGEWRVSTTQGDIVCEHVVTATGNYARQTGAMVGLSIPATPVVHQYWVTDTVPELVDRQLQGLPEMPVLRDESINGYVREERDGLMFGPYEPPERLEHFALDGVPKDFGADLLPEDLESVEQHWQMAIDLVPALGRAGIRRNVRGPICTTPDNLPLVGPAWGLENFWLAEGVSGGIVMGGGIAHYLSEWIVEGEPSIDLSEIDCRRFGAYANKPWVATKVKEAFGHNFGLHFPGYEWPGARPSKTAPCYERLRAERASWGSVYGWEVPNWFAPEGVEPRDDWSYREFNYFPYVAAEVDAIRNTAGLLDMTPMTKFEVSGPHAEDWLNSILANRVPNRPGRIALCHLLTHKGTVRSEFTVSRLSDDLFYVVATPRGERHDFDVLGKKLPATGGVELHNVTSQRGCFTLVGPHARDILTELTDGDLDNEAFPWLSARTHSVGFASDVRMLRVNYEGELGWELYHPIEQQLSLYDQLMEAGRTKGLKLAGMRAIESCRLDKSYRAMYRDLNVEHTAWESGLDRFIKLDNREFVGREALERQREAGLEIEMVALKVETVDADAYMNEAVYSDGKLVGRVTSGAHSHTQKQTFSMAYLDVEYSAVGTELEIPILGERRRATVIEDSPYDPHNKRPRM